MTTQGFDKKRDGICDSVLDAIGDTPLIRLNHVASHLKCQVLAKCEFLNAGGSVKDRIGKRMVLDAEAVGQLKEGVTTLIEPTSGNTGIGIALCAATRGYRCIITMPEKMSKEKVDILKALGAEIVRTPTEAAHDAPDSHISVAKRLQQEIPDAVILNQYTNPSNPLAHTEGTAEEIWKQTGGKIDMLVAGVGTGGTVSGLAKGLKHYNPNLRVVAVDPEGSILAVPDQLNDKNRQEPYHVEGIGYDFVPGVMDHSLVDEWIKSNDLDSLVMMRKLIRYEGLLCGGSSGAAVFSALKAAESLDEGQTCVVILSDSVRNYMTKALSDDWMINNGFVDHQVIKPKLYNSWWANQRVCDLPLANTPLTITADVTCRDAIALLKEEGFDMVPVVSTNSTVIGVVTEGNMTSALLNGRAEAYETVAEARVVYKTFSKVTMNQSLSDLAQALDYEPYVLITTEQRCYNGKTKTKRRGSDASQDSLSPQKDIKKVTTRSVVSGIVTRIDLLHYISTNAATMEEAAEK